MSQQKQKVQPAQFSRDEIEMVTDELHDHCFDLEGVRYDLQKQFWQIPYASYLAQGEGCAGCLLALLRLLGLSWGGDAHRREHEMDRFFSVSQVKGWRADDRSRIGIYSLDRVKFDSHHSQLALVFIEDCEVFIEVGPGFEIILQPGPLPRP